MSKKIFMLLIVFMILASPSGIAVADKPTDFDTQGNVLNSASDNGFDEWGYNQTARIFSGSGWDWCMGKFNNESYCTSYLGIYANDKLVMKWNADWDRGNAENWSNPPYNAWLNNQWNGKIQGGSDETWHYRYVWVGPCGAYGTPLDNGGYCIWGQFAVIMSHGTFENMHYWDSHAQPNGYGYYP